MLTMQKKYSRVLLAWVACIGLTCSTDSMARMRDVTLDKLIEKSDQIMYVEKVSGAPSGIHNIDDTPVVTFKTLLVLKGEQKKLVSVCNRQYSDEWLNLEEIEVPVVIFASMKGACYEPVWGHRSIVGSKNGIAYTASIFGQPEEQYLKGFLGKIRSLLKKAIR